MVALTRAVGRKHAMEMLLTGQLVKARIASEWGLVNRVIADAELVAETRKLANQIVEASPLIIGIGKRAFYEQINMDTEKAYDYTKRSDEPERNGNRRPGRNRRVSGKAQTSVVRKVKCA